MDDLKPTTGPELPTDPIPQIEAFFAERHAQTACPICVNPTWVLLDGPSAPTLLPFSGRQSVFGPPVGHALFAFACRNCGYVRLHLRSIVNGDVDLRSMPAVAGPTESPADSAGEST